MDQGLAATSEVQAGSSLTATPVHIQGASATTVNQVEVARTRALISLAILIATACPSRSVLAITTLGPGSPPPMQVSKKSDEFSRVLEGEFVEIMQLCIGYPPSYEVHIEHVRKASESQINIAKVAKKLDVAYALQELLKALCVILKNLGKFFSGIYSCY